MSWESILGFLFFIVISSLFNKGKDKNTKRQRNVQTKNTTSKRKTMLEDVLKEFKSDIDTIFGDDKQKSENVQKPSRSESTRTDSQKKTIAPKVREDVKAELAYVKDSVYSGEIGSGEGSYKIHFDRKSVIQGIIMAEILDKPISLRNLKR